MQCKHDTKYYFMEQESRKSYMYLSQFGMDICTSTPFGGDPFGGEITSLYPSTLYSIQSVFKDINITGGEELVVMGMGMTRGLDVSSYFNNGMCHHF
eukprot:7159804-Ditylum_brightwellii.AAC.1